MHIHLKIALNKFHRLLIVGTMIFIVFATIATYDTLPSEQEILNCLTLKAPVNSSPKIQQLCEREILEAVVFLKRIDHILQSTVSYFFYLTLIYLAIFSMRWIGNGEKIKT